MPHTTCSRCGEEFSYKSGKRAICPECGAVSKKAQSRRRDNDEVDEPRPRRKKRGRSKSTSVPVAVWAGGLAAAVLVVIGLVFVLSPGEEPRRSEKEFAKADSPSKKTPPPVTPPATKPEKNSVPRPNPQPTPNPNPQPTPTPSPTPDPIENPANQPEIDRDWPIIPPRKRVAVSPLDPNLTIVRVYPPAAGGKPLVVMDLPTEPYMRPGPFRGLLLRELVRQSFLLAAREELGAQTRDLLLREKLGDLSNATPTCTLELGWVAPRGKPLHITLKSGTGSTAQTVWEVDIPVPAGEIFDYDRVATTLETRSRTDLAEAIAKETKLTRVSRKPGQAEIAAVTKSRLLAMNWYDQFAAIRELHATFEKSANPAVAADLAIGYATLGVLTERNWTVEHKAYQARALLYAHRASATGTVEPLKWTLAYATCLIGLHARSLEYIEEARKADAGPAWASIIEAACRFDHVRLAKSPTPELSQLNSLLAYLTADNPYTRAHARVLGGTILETNPDCSRVLFGVLVSSEMGGIRKYTDLAPVWLTASLTKRMAKLPGAPEVRLRDDGAQAELEFLRAFDTSGVPASDLGEPSWGALTSAVRSVRFVTLDRRIHLFDRYYGIPPHNEARAVAPYLADHPDRGYYDAYTKETAQVRPAIDAFARALDKPSITLDALLRGSIQDQLLYGELNPGLATALEHLDDTATDLRFTRNAPPKEIRTPFTMRERAVSPYSGSAMAYLIETDWPTLSKQSNLDKTWAGQPAVMVALGRQRLEEKNTIEAERLFREAIKYSPDLSSYRALADIYKTDTAKYVEILDEFLRTPDDGLQHARVASDIAIHYLNQKEPRKAWPYAERAAQSKSSWGLRVGESCALALGDRQRAAAYAAERQRMYGDR